MENVISPLRYSIESRSAPENEVPFELHYHLFRAEVQSNIRWLEARGDVELLVCIRTRSAQLTTAITDPLDHEAFREMVPVVMTEHEMLQTLATSWLATGFPAIEDKRAFGIVCVTASLHLLSFGGLEATEVVDPATVWRSVEDRTDEDGPEREFFEGVAGGTYIPICDEVSDAFCAL
jgi:hypothetical protein